ncbi:uncharacterized protein LOC133516879 [Cydia pomonella]|uniref:uncharacterized protein LOC133516879 n=1 Tax=Cydia pomonella TaxID=82600 RepID=UPI002ADE358F|nr:uncharacterized protein LOC133516879 [Cydia pomonella]
MTIKFIFIGMTLGVALNGAFGSVVGLTYRDDFDFEQRYRHVHDCDPFHWHPLHLPEECADMYEKLIRSRLPVRFPKLTDRLYRPIHISPDSQSSGPSHYQHSFNPVYQTIIGVEEETVPRELTPYEEMLESVQKDVNNFPSVPSVRDMPNFGPVAVYQQPVSQISADMIKNVAMTYIHSLDDKDNKRKRHRSGKSGSKWKKLVSKVRRHERNGWKKINNGDIVSITKP